MNVMMSIPRILVFFICVPIISCTSVSKVDQQHKEAIQIIDSYIENKNLNIDKGSSDYQTFLQDVIYWNSHPELLSNDKGQLVIDYAKSYLSQNEPEYSAIDQVIPINNNPSKQKR